ncbi:MAG: helix-turn-helix domain-containing protein [Candidatus Dadabacteria bacterium]|nr:helix-turn-helix domain-containing protein [Candidatus Dadabacteria bacterium]
MEKRTYSIPEVAKVLGIGRTAAYEAARTGEIPTIRIGKRILVPVAALERLRAHRPPGQVESCTRTVLCSQPLDMRTIPPFTCACTVIVLIVALLWMGGNQ